MIRLCMLSLLCMMAVEAAENAAITSSRSVIQRVVGSRANDITIGVINKVDDCDVFEYEAVNGKLSIQGSSGVAICRGFYDYLKSNHLGIYAWSGVRNNFPEQLPDVTKKRVVSPYQHHYYLNVVTYGYTMPYWDWTQWEQELDWMALHGIDMPLALVANEAIAIRVWKELGLSQDEIDKFYVGPAHLPWQRMGCIVNHDGPIPASWHDDQIALQHKILDRMRVLGMKPIVPAFAGFVPQGLKHIYPGIRLHETSWGGWSPEHHAFLLMPDSPLFNDIGKRFIQEWEKEFGACKYYIADSFNEMEIPAPKDDKQKRYKILSDFGEAVHKSIKAGNPDAVWVMQGWMFGYQRDIWDAASLRALVSKVPDDNMLLLDLAVDYNAHFWHNEMNWDFYNGFFGKPWVYSVIPNMGGKTPYTGFFSFYAKGGALALHSPNKGRLEGFGMAPEGTENNEALYELIADMGWQSKEMDLAAWLKQYCMNRYGGYPAEMQKAWEFLRKSCYGSFTDHPRFNWQLRPGKMQQGTVNFSTEFQQAVQAFASCADDLGTNSLYEADLLELTAFYLGGKLEQHIQFVSRAYLHGNAGAADKAVEECLMLFDTIDRLLESHPLHRLDRWITFARKHGNSIELKDYYEHNARRLVTVWGPPVDDYAARIWSGLIRDYYKPRWEYYFKTLKTGKAFDFSAWEEQWVNRTGVSEITPCEKPVRAALNAIHLVDDLEIGKRTVLDGQVIGQWEPSKLSTDWQILEWKLPASNLKEMYGIAFEYHRGKHRLDIKAVSLVLDGKEVVSDKHKGTVGNKSRKNYYNLEVTQNLQANNECIIRATVKSRGGTDSHGQVVILNKKKPIPPQK